MGIGHESVEPNALPSAHARSLGRKIYIFVNKLLIRDFSRLSCAKMWDPRDLVVYLRGKVAGEPRPIIKNPIKHVAGKSNKDERFEIREEFVRSIENRS